MKILLIIISILISSNLYASTYDFTEENIPKISNNIKIEKQPSTILEQPTNGEYQNVRKCHQPLEEPQIDIICNDMGCVDTSLIQDQKVQDNSQQSWLEYMIYSVTGLTLGGFLSRIAYLCYKSEKTRLIIKIIRKNTKTLHKGLLIKLSNLLDEEEIEAIDKKINKIIEEKKQTLNEKLQEKLNQLKQR